MGRSPTSQIGAIVDLIKALDPGSILDVGIGCGQYGFLARVHLDDDPAAARAVRRIDGVEAFRPYLTPAVVATYDTIYEADARQALRQMSSDSYDLVLFIEVIEHMEHDEGESLLAEVLRVGRAALVTTPKEFIPQGQSAGNELETHRSLWTHDELRRAGARFFIPDDHSWLAVFCHEARFESALSRYQDDLRRAALRRLVPAPLRSATRSLRRRLGLARAFWER